MKYQIKEREYWSLRLNGTTRAYDVYSRRKGVVGWLTGWNYCNTFEYKRNAHAYVQWRIEQDNNK